MLVARFAPAELQFVPGTVLLGNSPPRHRHGEQTDGGQVVQDYTPVSSISCISARASFRLPCCLVLCCVVVLLSLPV
jgi:hypothetical protein